MTYGVADEICGIGVNLWLKPLISHCLRNNSEAITQITIISFFHRIRIAFGVCLAQMVSDISTTYQILRRTRGTFAPAHPRYKPLPFYVIKRSYE